MNDKLTSYDKLMGLVKSGTRVLDIGCASGYFGKRLIDTKGCKVWGIEIDREKAEEARKFYEDVYVGTIEDERFLNSIEPKFDIIIFADVIEHLHNPEPVLKFAARQRNENGYILLSVPNIGHWQIIKDLILGRFDYEETGLLDRTHLHFYTRNSLERLLSSCKLEIMSRDRTLGIFVSEANRILLWVKFKIALIKLLSNIFPDLFTYQFIYKVKPI